MNKRLYAFLLGLSFIISLIVSGVVMHIALEHNPMGAYCEYPVEYVQDRNCQINWKQLLILGVLWFSFTLIIIWIIYAISILIFNIFKYFISSI